MAMIRSAVFSLASRTACSRAENCQESAAAEASSSSSQHWADCSRAHQSRPGYLAPPARPAPLRSSHQLDRALAAHTGPDFRSAGQSAAHSRPAQAALRRLYSHGCPVGRSRTRNLSASASLSGRKGLSHPTLAAISAPCGHAASSRDGARTNQLNEQIPRRAEYPGPAPLPRPHFVSPPHDVEHQETGNQVERRLAMTGTSMVSCATSSTNGPTTETGGGTLPALTPLNRRKTRMASQAVRLMPSISA